MSRPVETPIAALGSPTVIPSRAPLSWKPVLAVATVVTVALLATADRYGYHRDELYFRLLGQHPRWGYVDQPPLTPLLARLGVEIFGDHLWALRVIPALLCPCLALVLALICRETGGGRAAQILASLGIVGTFPLIGQHTLTTATPDLVVWLLVVLFALRALLRDEPRYWLAAGLVTGLGLYNKLLVVLLLLALAIGLLAVGPRRVLRSKYLWAGVAVAAVVGAPNLAYQITHHFPQLEMAQALARNKGHDARVLLLPMQVLLLGLPFAPVCGAGLLALLRRADLRPARALAVAYLAMCGLLFILAGQFYYTVGLLLMLYAVGCVSVVGAARWYTVPLGLLAPVHLAMAALVALPLVPVDRLGATPIPAINQVVRDQVGWPTYVRQVADVYQSLPAGEKNRAVLLVGNYGEAGAVDRYGPQYGLPRAYSGQNELYHLAHPPESATVVVTVFEGDGAVAFLARQFRSCEERGRLNNGIGVDNEEQQAVIRVCRDPLEPWAELWPRFQHFD